MCTVSFTCHILAKFDIRGLVMLVIGLQQFFLACFGGDFVYGLVLRTGEPPIPNLGRT